MRIFLLLLFCFSTFSAFATPPPGYRLRVKIKGYNSTQLTLAYYMGGKTYVKDTAVAGSDGFFEFSDSAPLPAGMYLVVMQPDNNFFQLLVDKNNQQFTCETNLSGLINGMKITGSADNERMYRYMGFISGKTKEAEPLQQSIAKKEGDTLATEKKLDAIRREIDSHQQSLLQAHAGTLFATLLRAQRPPENNIPEFKGNETNVRQQRYEWARSHWFDHMSLTNPFFLRTDFFLPRVNNYLEKMTVMHPDSQIVAVEELLTRSRPSEEMFKYLASELLNRFAASKIVGMDKVYVHIAEKYYSTGIASWVEREQLKKIVDNAKALKPILIGEKAPALRIQTLDGLGFDLHGFTAKYTVLFFWHPKSGNGLRQLGDLKKAAARFKEAGLRIVLVARGTESNLRELAEAAYREQQLESVVNTVDTDPKTSGTEVYFLRALPQLFLLDENKRILSKQISADQLAEVMEAVMRGER